MPSHSASEDARERAYVAGIYVSCAVRAYAVLFPILLRRKTVALIRTAVALDSSCAGTSASIRAFTPVFDGLWTRVNAL